jgi:hypothetical protein
MLMLYFSQPLLSGASRTYGLRLNQTSQAAQAVNPVAAPNDFYAASPRRSLFDLQIRRRADVRLQLGNHVTWNLRSREFEFPNARTPKAIQFAANAP